MQSIFVQIASYRDPEIINTIKDCLKKAKNPENIYFGICLQRCKDDGFDDLSEFKKYPDKFRIFELDYTDSLGCCWARSQVQKLWRGEDYTLQIDSHTLFSEGWDYDLINYLKMCDSPKPILSTYPNPYTKDDNYEDLSFLPSTMNVSKIDDNGIITFIAYWFNDKIEKPIKGKFLSAGFIFTLGEFCKECIYDPNLYFEGEEMSLSARSYTYGYDIFHPPKNLIWHLYKDRKNNDFLHWDDHKQNEKNDWTVLNNKSINRIKKLFGIDCGRQNLYPYGFGNVRTLNQYEEYCGVDFKNKKLKDNINN